MRIGSTIIEVVRTVPLRSVGRIGVRSVWYLPEGVTVHAIETRPIPAGTYFLRPDATGKYQNWVIECELETRIAFYPDSESMVMGPRTNIEIHPGNTLTSSLGCFCPGMSTSHQGVVDSRIAVTLMRKVLQRDEPDPPVWVIKISEGI